MTEPWRCFVALDLDDDLRARLADAVAGWRTDSRTDGLRWSDPDGLHLTLAFLGGVDPGRVPAITEALAGVAARQRASAVRTGRLGAFARPGSARVLWYGVEDASGVISGLAADVAAALGLAPETSYRPHVTLARARRSVDLRDWIEEASASAPAGALRLGAFHLKRSRLGRGPARYETLASVSLEPDDD